MPDPIPHHERIPDPAFRHAVDLLDRGDTLGLQALLQLHPALVHQHVPFEDSNYFRSPTLLEFIAENPVRHGSLPANIVEITRVILQAEPAIAARTEALILVATGRIPRERNVQTDLIALLCEHGADPTPALLPAAVHGECEAVYALLRHGAKLDLPVAAALGRAHDFARLLETAAPAERHLALALAAQFGHTGLVQTLLDAGEDPSRYNPPPAHGHSTPLHQAAHAGHEQVVHLLVEQGARLDLKDTIFRGTPADWAQHAGNSHIERYLRQQETHTRPEHQPGR